MSTNKYTTLSLEKKDGVGTITIRRPEALNALSKATLTELSQALENLEKDATVKVAILTGEGRAFVAGADIKEMKDMTPLEATAFATMGQRMRTK